MRIRRRAYRNTIMLIRSSVLYGTMYRVASICFCIFQRCTSHRTMYMTYYTTYTWIRRDSVKAEYYLILHSIHHLFSFSILLRTEATDTKAASFTLRRRAMSGQFTHFNPACSETGDSATAMFLLSELVDVYSNCVVWELWRARCSQSTRREPHLLELLSCTIFHLPACISKCKLPRFLSRVSNRDFYAWQ